MAYITTKKNEIKNYTSSIFKSENARFDANLIKDFELITNGHCIYIPSFFCKKEDFSIIKQLAQELTDNYQSGMIKWSKHLKHENPQFSKTFLEIVNKMAEYFDVEVYHTRLNFYKDSSDWKPLHHDSHAYGGNKMREDFTMGASFGDERELIMHHDSSSQEFRFPQKNGDIFAFTSDINKKFMHGIPKSYKTFSGPRFSIIAWGRRRTLNERNGGKKTEEQIDVLDNSKYETIKNPEKEIKNLNEIEIKNSDVLELVNQLINSYDQNEGKVKDTKKNKRKNRVQHGYMVKNN